MVKLITFLTTITMLLLLNIGVSYIFQIEIIDIAFAFGLLGLLITAPNNPLSDAFNANPFIEAEGERHAKFGKIPLFAAGTYFLVASVATFIHYQSYFFN